MVLEKGEKIHLIVRRRFETDIRRHFIGEVVDQSGLMARVEGYVFVFHAGTNKYVKRHDKRIRLIGLADSGNLINILTPSANVDQAIYTQSPEQRLIVTDRKSFSLDINEFGPDQ